MGTSPAAGGTPMPVAPRTPPPGAAVTSPPGAVPPPPGAPGMTIPQLAAPAPGSMRGQFQQNAQQLVDKVNAAQSLEAYLSGRDQLAKLQMLGRFRRPGNSGQRGSGPGYGSSGPGGVGMGAGRTA